VNTRNGPPKDVPGLFRFVQEFGGRKYKAFMQPELSKKYDELKFNAEARELNLSNALDISLRISPESLERLVQYNRHILLAMSDEDCMEEFGESLSSESKEGLLFMMHQCCKVVLNIQQALGKELSVLMQKSFISSNMDGENESSRLNESEALKILTKRFATSLEILSNSRKTPQKPLHVSLEYDDGKKEKSLLTLRAIDVALELANQLQRCPFKKELSDELETRHHQELIVERDKKNLSPVNWSEQFEQAGLKNLPIE
jgi:hypothetical protein